MGGQVMWSCLKYIPHRLAGVALLAPVTNYWWSGFPANLSKEAYYKQLPQDQWTLCVAHCTPWLTYWWNTQNWFPASSVPAGNPKIFCRQDAELMHRASQQHIMQGEFESLHRDMIIGFGSWEFDRMDLVNPFPNGEGSVHLWHGDEDGLVPVTLQRYVAGKLPWIQYHEIPGAGHMFLYADGMGDAILNTFVLGEKFP